MSIEFRPSSFCHNGECVEVAVAEDGSAVVRDGKDPDGPELAFTAEEWATFVHGVKSGEFDRA